MRKILIAVAVVLVGTVAQAQQVIPVISEAKLGKKSYKNTYTVQNNTVSPMPVVVEAKQLIAGPNGQPAFAPLPDDVHVELTGDTSAVIPPKGQHAFDFKVESNRSIAVVFFNGMSTGKSKEGVNIRLWLPSVFYLCTQDDGGEKGCRTRTKAKLGITE